MNIPSIQDIVRNASGVNAGLAKSLCSAAHMCRVCTRTHEASQCGFDWARSHDVHGRNSRFDCAISDTDLACMIHKHFRSTMARRGLNFCDLPCKSCLTMLRDRKDVEPAAHMQALWWVMFPDYISKGGTELLALLTETDRVGTPILQRAGAHVTALPEEVAPVQIEDLYSLLCYLLQNPDTKCAECSSSLFPEEVSWLPWWKVPYLQTECPALNTRLGRFGCRKSMRWPNIPHICDVHELAPDWRVADRTPYGFDCTVRIRTSKNGPDISVCREDCLKTRPARWFHPPKNTSLMWPDLDELPRKFNPPDGVSLQHLAPVQCRTSVLRPAEHGLYNDTWQMLLLCSDKTGVSTGSVNIPYSKCSGRGCGWMGVNATELWENTILQSRPDLAPWHASVFSDYTERMHKSLTTAVADCDPMQSLGPRVRDGHLPCMPHHHDRCSQEHCWCKMPYRSAVVMPTQQFDVCMSEGVEIVVPPQLIQWLAENAPAASTDPPLSRKQRPHRSVLAYVEHQTEVRLCTGYEKSAGLANHVFFASLVEGITGARMLGKKVSIAYAAYVNRCKDLNIPTEHALATMFPYHYTLLHDDGTPVGSMPSSLWSARRMEKAGFAPLASQIRAMLCRLGSSTAYDPVLHSTLFSLLLTSVQKGRDASHIVKYGLESAFPEGISSSAYTSWYGHELYDYTQKQQCSSQERFLFLQALVKRFENICWFMTVTLNMSKTAGMETMTEGMRADNQSWSAHCSIFVRKWHRTVLAMVEWLVNGKEQPLGPLRHRFVRAEFQPDRGGIQHYHILLETLLDLFSSDMNARECVLGALRSCVTRNIYGALHRFSLPEQIVNELSAFAAVVLKHNHTPECMTRQSLTSDLLFCKRGCPWGATTRPEGEAVHIRLCADPHVQQVLFDLGIAYANEDGSFSLHGIPDAQIHLYQTGGLGSDEMSSVNIVIFLIVVSNSNLQLVDKNIVVDYLEWYMIADNERSLMYLKHNHDGTWDIHAKSDNWHKKGEKPNSYVGCSMATAEMIFLAVGLPYVTCDVDRRGCPAVPLSRRFMRYYNPTCVANYAVIDELNNVTMPVDMSCIGHNVQVNPLQSGRGRSRAMIWTPATDLANLRKGLSPKYTTEQIDLYLSFYQVRGLQPDNVSLWAGRDPELLCLSLEDYLAHTHIESRTMSRQRAQAVDLSRTAAERGCFRDVFSQCVRLRASLFIESYMQDVAVNLIGALCAIDKIAALSVYQSVNQSLPRQVPHSRRFDFAVLPPPFDRLVGTLTDCVVMLKTLNPCDGPQFLYQWALRNSYGPTEADIFRSMCCGGTIMDVLEDNNLVQRDAGGSITWQNIMVQHFYKDVQFQPLHRRDREGILERSMEQLCKQCDNTCDVLTCVAAEALMQFQTTHGAIHVIFYNNMGRMSLACLMSNKRNPPAVIIACTQLNCHEASLVAGHLANTPSDVLQLLQSLRGSEDMLFNVVTGPPHGVSTSTSLAVINNEHQTSFVHHCEKRLASLLQAVQTMPEWKQVPTPAWAADKTCKCNTERSELFPCDVAWADMQMAITIITNALHDVRDPAAANRQRTSVVLTGPAGSGKTHLLKEALRRALQRCVAGHCSQCMSGSCCGCCRLNCECSAATSLRSAGLCSYNLHKLFGWSVIRQRKPQQDNPTALFASTMNYLKRHPHLLQYMRLLDVLFIDELAFVPNSHMEAIHLVFKELKRNDFFCGNLLIVSTSDHYQNEPIHDRSILEDVWAMQFFLPLSLVHMVRCQCSILHKASLCMRTPQMSVQAISTVLQCLQFCNTTALQLLDPCVPVILGRRDNMETIIRTRTQGNKKSVMKIVARDFAGSCGHASKPTAVKAHHSLLDRATRTSYRAFFAKGSILCLKYNLDTESNLLNGTTLEVVSMDVANETLMCRQISPPPATNAGLVHLSVILLNSTARDGSLTLQRRHIPAVSSLVDTCHGTQGNDYMNGVALYLDGSANSLWSRAMMYTTLSRSSHIARITILATSEAFVMSLLSTSQPRLVQIDEWVHNKNGLAATRIPFIRSTELYKPIPANLYPSCHHLCYCVANNAGHTYIGYTSDILARIRTHNTEGSNRPPIMDYIPPGWQLLIWVGPFETQAFAENFERKWQAAGKTGLVRSLSMHLTAAMQLAARFNVTVHHNQVC